MTVVEMTAATRREWLDERRTGIGGSDAPAVFGLSPWVSRLRLWMDKTGAAGVEQTENPAMHWGTLLEPVVADEWARVTGRRAVTVPEWHDRPDLAYLILRHPEHPWMLANLDRFVLDDNGLPAAALEVKTANAFSGDDWADGPPPHVDVQVQHQLAVTGLPEAHVAVLIGGSDFRHFTIERDDALIADLIHGEAVFWDMVVAGTPPEADGHPDTGRALADRWKDVPRSTIDLPHHALDLIDARRSAKARCEETGAELARVENEIKSLLAENTDGYVDGRLVVTWRETKTGSRRLVVK